MNIIGLVVSFAFVFCVIGVTGLCGKKLRLGEEASRKIIHIGVSNWVIIAIIFFDSACYAVIPPLCFVAINWLSHRKNIFSAMERKDNASYGTVWYAVSLFLTVFFSYCAGKPYLAACGILSMGYGDGFAAIIGARWGKHKLPAPFSSLSLEGSATVFVCAFAATYIVLTVFAVPHALSAAFVCAVTAAFAELASARGIDNLTLPVSVTAAAFLMGYEPFAAVMPALALTVLIVFAALYLNALTAGASASAFVLGSLVFISGGLWLYAALIEFFILGSIAGKMGKKRKRKAEKLHARTGGRSSVQVLANGLPALLFAAPYFVLGNGAFLLAAFATLAAACADTFSSELGMLGNKEPVSIIGFKKLQRGISGGVTAFGFLAGLAGAACVALTAWVSFGVRGFAAVAACGFIGTVTDSILGAAVQAKYSADGRELTERPGGRIVSGFSFINNDTVNFISVSISGFVCLAVSQFAQIGQIG